MAFAHNNGDESVANNSDDHDKDGDDDDKMVGDTPLNLPTETLVKSIHHGKWHTVFRRIHVPGAEAENEPLSLSDFNHINRVNSWTPWN